MRAYVTGATGFVGGRLVELLGRRGLEVTCLVRDPARAGSLRRPGVSLVEGDITDAARLRQTIGGHEVVFHLAAWYQVGVSPRDEERMRRINVGGTEHVLRAAGEAGARKIVYCSTVGALGSSGQAGELADESHPHDGRFQCLYVKTKHEAHRRACALAAEGLPIVIALPGAIYGEGDESIVAVQMRLVVTGRLAAIPRAPAVYCYTHVDDVAEGLWLAAERGAPGESYVLAGPALSLEEFYGAVAGVAGAPLPRRRVAPWLLRLGGWLADRVPGVRRLAGELPLSREAAAMALDANWAFSSAKAVRELGWQPRSFEDGLRDTLPWISRSAARGR